MVLSHLSSVSPTSLTVLAFAGAVIYFTGLCLYRVFLHPLSGYPGPLLAKITDLYSTYYALRGDRHVEFFRAHEKYGPIVRFGPNSLSFNSNSALKEIYGFKANVRKSRFYEAFWANKHAASTHSSIDQAIHARKRRVLSNAFSDAAMKAMEKYTLAHIRQFCENLAGTQPLDETRNSNGYGPAINVSDQTSYLAFDAMGDLCFGKAFGMLERPDNRFAIDLVSQASWRHLICGTYLPIHEYHLDKALFPKIAANRARYMQYSRAQTAERTKLGLDVDRKDFFYYLLNAKDPETGAGFSNAELWGESNLLIIAGSDTTATALAAAIFYLVHNPQKLAILATKVRTAFDTVEEIHIGPTLSSVTYLRACIDEAMRLSPSVPGLLPREVLAGGMEIDGHEIPAGTIVGVPHYALHHNPDYFQRPFDFQPERWLPGSGPSSTAQSVAVAQSAFCPFSIGPRGCIGKGESFNLSRQIYDEADGLLGMAYAELTTALARVVFMYDMRLAPGTTLGESSRGAGTEHTQQAEFELKDIFASMKNGPMVQFRSR